MNKKRPIFPFTYKCMFCGGEHEIKRRDFFIVLAILAVLIAALIVKCVI